MKIKTLQKTAKNHKPTNDLRIYTENKPVWVVVRKTKTILNRKSYSNLNDGQI